MLALKAKSVEDVETGGQGDCQGAVAVGAETGSNHPAMSRTSGGTGTAPDIRLCHGDWHRPRTARTRNTWPGRVGMLGARDHSY